MNAPRRSLWRKLLRPELVLLVFVLSRVSSLYAPVGGQHHMWRQADTAAVSRNLAFESPDIFHPRVDMRGEKTGITGMEFPAYQAVVAVLMFVTRSDADFFGKLVALLSAIGCWWLLVRLLTRRWNVDPWAAHAACASVPILLGYADKFMPETTALLFALIHVERIEHWWHSRRRNDLAVATLFLLLASLTRPYMIFFGLFLVMGVLAELLAEPIILPNPQPPPAGIVVFKHGRIRPLFMAGVAVLLLFFLWYGVWCPHLVRAYGIDYFFTGNTLSSTLHDLTTREFYKELLEVLTWFYVKKPLVLLALLGLLTGWSRARASRSAWWSLTLLLGLPVVTLPILLLVIGHHFQPHVYYFFGLVPTVVVLFGLGLDLILHRVRAAFLPAAAFAILNCAGTFPAHFSVVDVEWVRYTAVVPDVTARVPRDDLVVVENLGHFPWHLHPIRRKGWVVDRAQLLDPVFMRDVQTKGGRWVLWLDASTNRYQLSSMPDWLAMHG